MFCKKCGKELKEGEQFCTGCGTKVSVVPETVPMKAMPNETGVNKSEPIAPVPQNSNVGKGSVLPIVVGVIVAIVVIGVLIGVGMLILSPRKVTLADSFEQTEIVETEEVVEEVTEEATEESTEAEPVLTIKKKIETTTYLNEEIMVPLIDVGSYIVHEYDKQGRETRTTAFYSDDTIYTEIDYYYDNNGNKKMESWDIEDDVPLGDYPFTMNYTYVYDEAGRVIREQSYRDGSMDVYTIEYEYDEQGRRLQARGEGYLTFYEYDDKDRLIKEMDGIGGLYQTYTYDERGNVKEISYYGMEDQLYRVDTCSYEYWEEVPESENPNASLEEGIHNYVLLKEDATWHEAYQECKEMGGYLAHINTKEEYDYVTNLIKESGEEGTIFWIGGLRQPNSYEYYWVNSDGSTGNEALNNNPKYDEFWLTGEPSFQSDGVEECYMNMFYRKAEDKFVWNDTVNDIISIADYYAGRVGYICEYEE